MVLDSRNPNPLSGARKEHFEQLRKNNVPRFLFRAFDSKSGGGSALAVNNPNLIVPHAYMTPSVVSPFYATPEKLLRRSVDTHYYGKPHPLSPFSSWAASLHLVLCYASSLGDGAYVAIMDTGKVDGEVLAWHVPHLKDGNHHHEYLAHGIIKSSGYVAVPLLTLQQNGLYDVFPELEEPRRVTREVCDFGFQLREEMFNGRYGRPKTQTLKTIRLIADLFGELWFPIATALLCVRPWPWFQPSVDNGRSKPQTKELVRILQSLDVTVTPSWLESNLSWLQHEAVVTAPDSKRHFPDVRQWIDLLHAISRHDLSGSKKRKREKETLVSGDEEGPQSKRRVVEANKVGSP